MKRRLTCSAASAAVLAVSLSTTPAAAQAPDLVPLEPEVIDYGAEPRQLLRYTWHEGHTETVETTMTISTSVSLDDTPVMAMDIPMAIAMDSRVSQVGEDGTARMEFVYTRFEVSDVAVTSDFDEDLASTMSDVTDEFDAMTRDLIGVTSWQVVDDRGRVVEMGVDMPEAFPAELRQQFDQMSTTATAAEPLPAEPVGVGARWVSAGLFDSAGVPFAMETETQLVAIDAAGVTLQRIVSMDLDDAADIFGEMPPGTDVSIEESVFSGGGETRVAFAGIAPEGDFGFDFGFEIAASGEEDGEPVSMDMRMDMTMAIEMSVE